jgi:hypothetical protein
LFLVSILPTLFIKSIKSETAGASGDILLPPNTATTNYLLARHRSHLWIGSSAASSGAPMPRALDQRTYQCRSQPITASVNSHGRGTPKDYQNLPAQTPFSKLRTNGYMKGYRVEFGNNKKQICPNKTRETAFVRSLSAETAEKEQKGKNRVEDQRSRSGSGVISDPSSSDTQPRSNN